MQQKNDNQKDVEKKQTAGGQQDQQPNKGFEKPARRDEDLDEEDDQSIEQAPSRETDALNKNREPKDKKSKV